MIIKAKVFSLEELKDMNKIIMDKLHGILKTYEMWTVKVKASSREAPFKASNNTIKCEDISNDSSNHESDTK